LRYGSRHRRGSAPWLLAHLRPNTLHNLLNGGHFVHFLRLDLSEKLMTVYQGPHCSRNRGSSCGPLGSMKLHSLEIEPVELVTQSGARMCPGQTKATKLNRPGLSRRSFDVVCG
jgi:hypothetical protein